MNEYKIMGKRVSLQEAQKKMDRVMKNKKKFDDIERIWKDYYKVLGEYKNKHQISHVITVFDYPYSYFKIFQGRLYFSQGNIEITESTMKEFFLLCKLPYEKDDDTIKKIISALKKLLNLYNKSLSYLQYVDNYKIKYKVNFRCFLEDIDRYFFLFDDNLCYKSELRFIAITDKVVQDIFKEFHMLLPTYHERKKMFYTLAKEMRKVEGESSNHKNPYFIIYKTGVSLKKIEYCKDDRCFKRKSVSKYSYNRYKEVEVDNKQYNEKYYPEKFSKLLNLLSKGDIHVIDQLAEVFASIFATENITKKLTVFYVPKNVKSLIRFLEILIDDIEYVKKDISFKAMCDPKNIKKLINYKLDGKFCIINHKKNLPEIEKVNTFRKIIDSCICQLKSVPYNNRKLYHLG